MFSYFNVKLTKETIYKNSKNMEEFLAKIHPDFNQFLIDNNMVICGSTASYFYLKLHHISPNFIPNDIDVYVICNENNYLEKYDYINKSLNKLLNEHYNLNNVVGDNNVVGGNNVIINDNDDINSNEVNNIIQPILEPPTSICSVDYIYYVKKIVNKETSVLPPIDIVFLKNIDSYNKLILNKFDFDYMRLYYNGISFTTNHHSYVIGKKESNLNNVYNFKMLKSEKDYVDYIDQINIIMDTINLLSISKIDYKEYMENAKSISIVLTIYIMFILIIQLNMVENMIMPFILILVILNIIAIFVYWAANEEHKIKMEKIKILNNIFKMFNHKNDSCTTIRRIITAKLRGYNITNNLFVNEVIVDYIKSHNQTVSK